MRSAPSVTYPVGCSRDAGHLLMIVWVVGAFCAGAACYQWNSISWRHTLLALSVLLAGAAGWQAGWRRPLAEVHFDGQDWSLSGAQTLQAAQISVHLDIQFLLCARLTQPGQPSQWLWLERRAAPGRWHDLRRAVYSRPPAAEPATALPSARASGTNAPTSTS